jgi:mannosylglycerate hydrolase
LLRATSYLSRGQLRTRGGGAGPWTPTLEANCLGKNCCEYGWADHTPGTAEQQIIRAYELTDLFEGRLIPFCSGKFSKEQSYALIEISNPALYVTACYIEQNSVMLRILNTVLSPQQAKVSIAFPISKVSKVNLLGENAQVTLSVKKESSGKSVFELSLEQNELITLKLDLD